MGLWGAPGATVPTALPPSPTSEPERCGRTAPALSLESGAVRPACTAPKPLRSELMMIWPRCRGLELGRHRVYFSVYKYPRTKTRCFEDN